MKLKFASLDKPSRIKAPPKISPQKGPLKNISPWLIFGILRYLLASHGQIHQLSVNIFANFQIGY